MTASATATGIGRDYCRGCATTSTQRFAGWATADGHENGVRPRAFYRQCDTCGLNRLVLHNVNDAEGLCRLVLSAWMRRNAIGIVDAVGSPTGDFGVDADDALSWLTAEVWHLYTGWDPVKGNGSFLAYASELLPHRLTNWSIQASGEASERSKGRRFPKAHAASVSVSYDELTAAGDDEDHDGSYASLGTFVADHAETLSLDLCQVLATGSRGATRDQRERGEQADRGATTAG